MTPASDLPARPSNVAVVFIAASPDRIWKALSDPVDQATCFGGRTEIGETGEARIRQATDKWPALTGIVLAREAPCRLLLSWGAESDPPRGRVESLIEPPANGTTRVTINGPRLGCAPFRPQDACRDRQAPATPVLGSSS